MCSHIRMKLKVASSNIRFDNPKDGDHDWKGRREILADVINSFNPDLLGTQEGWQWQLYDLKSLLEELDISDSHRSWIDERMYPSIFYRREDLHVLDSGDIWLSETPDVVASKSFNSAFPRLCTWSKFKCSQKRTLLFVDVHLDHIHSETREAQIGVLINEISKINDCTHMILCGDFNESPREDVRKLIVEKLGLYDPWTAHEKPEETSHHNFTGERCDGARIDWIMLSKNISCDAIDLHRDSHRGIFPSDHFPVFATIELK